MVSTRGERRRKEIIMEEALINSAAKRYSRRHPQVPVPFSSSWNFVESLQKTNGHSSSFVGSLQKTNDHSSSLTAATRILNPPCTSEPTVMLPSPNWVGHSDNEHSHHYRLDVPRVLLLQGPQEPELVAPQLASDQPSRENVVPEKNTTSHVTTLNITEFAKRLQDDEDDDLDEVQSVLNPSFDYVNGCKVKKEHATLVRAIFAKYGDITWGCAGKPAAIVSFFLERVCIMYEKLKETKFSEPTGRDLNVMLDEVKFLESEKLDLGWLRKKLQHICETKTSLQSYLTFKEEGRRSNTIIATLENELEANRRQRLLMEDKLVAEKAKCDQIKNKVQDIKVRVDHLWRHSLVDGLL